MKKEIKDPNKQANTGSYSSGLEVDGWVFVSGQGPLDMQTGDYKEGTIEEETLLTLQNVERVLKQAGCTRADVVKSTCHLADIEDFQMFDKAYREFFAGTILPVRTTVEGGVGQIKVEIDVIAYKR